LVNRSTGPELARAQWQFKNTSTTNAVVSCSENGSLQTKKINLR
jgi:hypothetical protein